MVKLLDLCGMSRAEIHQKLLATLTNKMINEVIPALDKEKQDWLLRQSFPFLERDVKELKVVPLALLKQRSDIPTEYLEKFAAQEKLWDTLSKLPNLVQQQVWEIESGGRNFEARVAPHLDAYRTTTGQRHLNYAAKASFTVASKVPSERWRGQSKELEALVNIVGARRGLLDTTCRMLMRRFCDSAAAGGHQTVWASLLGDFLLTYEIQTSVSKPPNITNRLKLAKVLDQAIRNGVLTNSSIVTIHKALRSMLPTASSAAGASSSSSSSSTSSSSSATSSASKSVVNPERLASALESAWSKLSTLDVERIFALPVTEAQAPGYSSAIEHPMDLSLMRSKIGKARGGYFAFNDFCGDIDLMVQNCWTFNKKKSPLGQYATKFKGQWERVRESFRTQALPAVQRPAVTVPPPPPPPGGFAPLPAQSAGSNLEVGVAFMLLAQPAVSALLNQTLMSAMDGALRDRKLPARHQAVPVVLQLLQMSCGARDMVAAQAYAVPAPDQRTLRVHLPLVQRYIGETDMSVRSGAKAAAPSSAEELLTSKGPAVWKLALSIPIVRCLVMAICGSSLYHASAQQQQQQQSDYQARVKSCLRLLTLCADVAMDGKFLDFVNANTAQRKDIRSDLKRAAEEFAAAVAISK